MIVVKTNWKNILKKIFKDDVIAYVKYDTPGIELAISLENELQKTEKEFEMFWVSEWHKSGTSVHNHLLFRGDIKYDINL